MAKRNTGSHKTVNNSKMLESNEEKCDQEITGNESKTSLLGSKELKNRENQERSLSGVMKDHEGYNLTDEVSIEADNQCLQKSIEEAFEKQRQSEKEMFKELIKDNVRLDREIKQVASKFEEIKTQNDLLILHLGEEKQLATDQSVKIEELEKEVKKKEKREVKLTRTLEAIVLKKKKKKLEDDVEIIDNTEDLNDDDDKKELLANKSHYEQKIRDLQARLKRMSKDGELKDRRILAVEAELHDMNELVREMERHIDVQKLEQIKFNVSKTSLATGRTTSSIGNRRILTTNVVGTDKPATQKSSKTCTIL